MKIINIEGRKYVECYGKARGKEWTKIYYPLENYQEQTSKKKKPTESKVLEETLDRLWSKIVKQRAGSCAKCGRKLTLNAHHIIGRRNKRTRWDLDNGICLCASCHALSSVFSAHQTPDLFLDWLEKEYPGKLENLRQRANSSGQKQDKKMIYYYLKQE